MPMFIPRCLPNGMYEKPSPAGEGFLICEKHEKAPRKTGQELKLYRIITETHTT